MQGFQGKVKVDKNFVSLGYTIPGWKWYMLISATLWRFKQNIKVNCLKINWVI